MPGSVGQRHFMTLTLMTRTEGYSGRVMTRTEGISVRVIRMLRQLVGFGPVERANVKFDEFFQ